MKLRTVEFEGDRHSTAALIPKVELIRHAESRDALRFAQEEACRLRADLERTQAEMSALRREFEAAVEARADESCSEILVDMINQWSSTRDDLLLANRTLIVAVVNAALDKLAMSATHTEKVLAAVSSAIREVGDEHVPAIQVAIELVDDVRHAFPQCRVDGVAGLAGDAAVLCFPHSQVRVRFAECVRAIVRAIEGTVSKRMASVEPIGAAS